MDPYIRMRAWLMPLVALSACIGTGSGKETGTTPEGIEGTGCLTVAASETSCPLAADVVMEDLVGGCGSTTLSIDGEGSFGASPTGYGDTGSAYCCYPIHETEAACTYGRPYVVDGRARLAEVRDGSSWCGDPLPPAEGIDDARALLAAAWDRAAQDEHAAVAAFAKIALELVGFGAPADLVDATLQAAREEVVHARLGFALASRYAGTARSAATFPLEPTLARHPDLASFAAATAREGCIGETVTTLVATDCLARTTDPEVRAALSRIVDDENGHARLAWRTVRWAIDVGGEDVRAAVAAVFDDVARRGLPLPDRLADGPHRDVLVAHGLPDAAQARRSIDRALAEVVLPAARGLLARQAPRADVQAAV